MGYSPLGSKDSDKTQGLSRPQHSTAKHGIYHVLHLFFSFNHVSWRSLHINAQRASLAFFFYNTTEEYAPVWVCYSLFNQHLLMTIYFVSKHFISDNVAEDNLALYVISEVCSLIPRSWIADRVLQNLQNKFFIFYFFGKLSLCCCLGFSLAVTSGWYSLVAVCRLLIAVASLVAESVV